MLLSDQDIIRRLKIKPSDKVLDIGGSMRQHTEIKVDTIVDLIRPEEAPYGPSPLLAKNFIKVDITREKLPFKNKEFDICLCTHTLEDLPSPFSIMEEMGRVAKRGLIVTPSMGKDMEFSKIDFTDWLTGARRMPGLSHHKWFFVSEDGRLKVIPKNYPVLYTSDFHMTGWLGDKECCYYWKGRIKYSEFFDLNIHNLIDEYKKYFKRNEKVIRKGRTLFFVDNPLNLARSLAKKMLKRGTGYKYRKNL